MEREWRLQTDYIQKLLLFMFYLFYPDFVIVLNR